VVSDLSRTVALAIRLFGNVMSGSVVAGILLSVAPLFFPVLMKSLDLLIGTVQAYIFGVLATVYIAAATKSSEI
jgi:F-type H+-transporting ATPase subunit a